MAKQENINEMELDTVDFCSKCYSLKIKYEDSIGMDCCEDCGCTDFKKHPLMSGRSCIKKGMVINMLKRLETLGSHLYFRCQMIN